MSAHRLWFHLSLGLLAVLPSLSVAAESSLPPAFWRDVKASAMRSEVPATRAALATLLADQGFVRDFDRYVRRLRRGRAQASAHASLEAPSSKPSPTLSPRDRKIVDDFVSRTRQEIAEKSFPDDPWGLARAEWTQGLIVDKYRDARRRMATTAPEEGNAWRHLVDYLENAKAALGRAHRHRKDFSDYMTNASPIPGASAPSGRASLEDHASRSPEFRRARVEAESAAEDHARIYLETLSRWQAISARPERGSRYRIWEVTVVAPATRYEGRQSVRIRVDLNSGDVRQLGEVETETKPKRW